MKVSPGANVAAVVCNEDKEKGGWGLDAVPKSELKFFNEQNGRISRE